MFCMTGCCPFGLLFASFFITDSISLLMIGVLPPHTVHWNPGRKCGTGSWRRPGAVGTAEMCDFKAAQQQQQQQGLQKLLIYKDRTKYLWPSRHTGPVLPASAVSLFIEHKVRWGSIEGQESPLTPSCQLISPQLVCSFCLFLPDSV